jgi:thioesterase domain-containing protein
LKAQVTAEIRERLQSKLPAYMIPNSFIAVDQLPKLPNGKIDRHAVAALDAVAPLAAKPSAPPANPTEVSIAHIWEESLGVTGIGANSNFFDLGGHSLIGIQVMSRINESFGVSLALGTLFEAPTLAALAKRVEAAAIAKNNGHAAGHEHKPNTGESVVVALQPEGARPPFFCVAPASGTVFVYYQVAASIGEDQPFLALQDPRLVEVTRRIKSAEQLAAAYIEAMRQVQPDGPYYIGGWSYGGIVAFEIAQQLTKAGQQVGLLALFDCMPGANDVLMNPREILRFVKGGQRSARFAFDVVRDCIPYVLDALYLITNRLRSKNGAERLPITAYARWALADAVQTRLLRNANVGRILSRDSRINLMQITNARKVLSVLAANLGEFKRYIYSPWHGNAVLFRAESTASGQAIDPNDTVGWDQYVLGDIQIETIPGNHAAIFAPGFAEVTAQRLRKHLDEAMQPAGPVPRTQTI